MTFPSYVVRKLARSEESFAQTKNFHGLRLSLSAPIDVDAMSVAFDTLLQAHPVLAAHLETGPDGRHLIVTDDLVHPGVWVVADDEDRPSSVRLDQRLALVNLLVKTSGAQQEVTLYSHHSIADGHHQFSLLTELFCWYTDVVCGGDVGPGQPEPAPLPLEAVLEERGIRKQRRSGLERLMPAMFAYDLSVNGKHTIAHASPSLPQQIPTARCQLTEAETRALERFCRDRRLSLNTVVAAVILLGEWQVRNTPHMPIPYLYPVDLRFLLTPPVSATGCTNPVGMAAYLAEIAADSQAVALARDISETFRADLSDGVIQQSLLHFTPEEVDVGLPNIVLCTDMGAIPDLRTPPGLKVIDFGSEVHRASLGGVDLYCLGTLNGRLGVELHTYSDKRQRCTEAIHSLLCALPLEDGWMAD